MTNIWSQFEKLTEKGAMSVVTVLSHEDGMSVVENVTGNEFKVLGTTVAIGSKAYVKDGMIAGDAPDLPHVGPIYVD